MDIRADGDKKKRNKIRTIVDGHQVTEKLDSWESKRIRTAVGKAVQARTNASSPSPPPTQVHMN